jgi:L-threonylcarbamoyladenylate synthase
MPPTRRATAQELDEAVTALRNGELVAFPTETVYGLGANARDPAALKRIFEAKGRPADHPLILHIDNTRFLQRWVADVPEAAHALAARFWPGPLTLVLRRGPEVSDVLTGGQDTIAIRIPSHPMALQLLTAFGGALAAPSANRYGRISATRPEHVREEFGPLVRVILDGGECTIGLESTILSLASDPPQLLRPGKIAAAQIESVIGPIAAVPRVDAPRVPGTHARHYAPQTPVNLVPSPEIEEDVEAILHEGRRVAVLAQRPPKRAYAGVTWINAGRRADVYARELYSNLRSLDKAGADMILVERVSEGPEWLAVRDRLGRASARGVVSASNGG